MTTQEIKDLKSLIDNMNMQELLEYLSNTPGHYSDYSSLYNYSQGDYSKKKAVFEKLYDHFNINFVNKSVLDLGPGTGESLDVAKNRGAVKMEFIDRDILIFRYNELKGYNGCLFDYTTPSVNQYNTKHDIIISKGAFNSSLLNEHRHILLFKDVINWIESIAKELIIIIPTFKRTENGYVCENYEEFMKSEFSEELFSRNFKTDFIDGCNNVKTFPVTFYKNIVNESL